jgi:hypothetical protein
MIHHVVDVTYLNEYDQIKPYRYNAEDKQDSFNFAEKTMTTGLRFFLPLSQTFDYYPVHRVLHALCMSFED